MSVTTYPGIVSLDAPRLLANYRLLWMAVRGDLSADDIDVVARERCVSADERPQHATADELFSPVGERDGTV